MKTLKVVLLPCLYLILNSSVYAATYYVSNTGSGDTLQTLEEVNALDLNPGDEVLFKSGHVWRGILKPKTSGNPDNYIRFASYGPLEKKPRILGSEQAVNFINVTGNIWESGNDLLDPYTLGFLKMEIWFELPDGSVDWGNPKRAYTADYSNLNAKYDWTWNNNKIYIYSESDPNSTYVSVEAAQREDNINLNDQEYIEIDGFEIAYGISGTSMETYPTGDFSGYTLRNCYIHHFGIKDGGGYGSNVCYSSSLIENNEIHDCGRRSIAVYNYGNALITNVVIQNNVMYNGYHTTGLDMSAGGGPSGSDAGSFDSVIYRNNLVFDYEFSNNEELGYGSESHFIKANEGTGDVWRFYFYNNVIVHAQGAGLHLMGVKEAYVYHNTFLGANKLNKQNVFGIRTGGDTANVWSRNNIFYNDATERSTIPVYMGGETDHNDFDSDYNLYFVENGTTDIIRDDGGGSYNVDEWDQMRAAFGWEANSPQPANPLFIEAGNPRLQDDSPAVGAGVVIPGYTEDFFGNPPKTAPTIGAVQVSWPAGEDPIEKTGFEFQVFPNPATRFINVFLNPGQPFTNPLLISIFDTSGKKLFEGSKVIESGLWKIPLKLDAGLYIVRITSGNSLLGAREIMIK